MSLKHRGLSAHVPVNRSRRTSGRTGDRPSMRLTPAPQGKKNPRRLTFPSAAAPSASSASVPPPAPPRSSAAAPCLSLAVLRAPGGTPSSPRRGPRPTPGRSAKSARAALNSLQGIGDQVTMSPCQGADLLFVRPTGAHTPERHAWPLLPPPGAEATCPCR